MGCSDSSVQILSRYSELNENSKKMKEFVSEELFELQGKNNEMLKFDVKIENIRGSFTQKVSKIRENILSNLISKKLLILFKQKLQRKIQGQL